MDRERDGGVREKEMQRDRNWEEERERLRREGYGDWGRERVSLVLAPLIIVRFVDAQPEPVTRPHPVQTSV